MTRVNQPSAMPTNKLMTGALIGPAVNEFWGRLMTEHYPPLSGPEVSMLVGTIAAVTVAYWVRDRANVRPQ
jgi:hypothetical protein